MPGAPGTQNGKGGPKCPELCIKAVIKLCTGISQNHHPCLLTLPFVANVCRGGGKNYSYATAAFVPSVQLEYFHRCIINVRPVPSLPAFGPWAPPSRTGPLARKCLPGFPYSWSLRRLRQKISSIYCTVICNYPSAAQEQPFTVGLFCITKTVKLSW